MTNIETKNRNKILKESILKGEKVENLAKKYDLSTNQVSFICKNELKTIKDNRVNEMMEFYKTVKDKTLVAKKYDITTERVRQIAEQKKVVIDKVINPLHIVILDTYPKLQSCEELYKLFSRAVIQSFRREYKVNFQQYYLSKKKELLNVFFENTANKKEIAKNLNFKYGDICNNTPVLIHNIKGYSDENKVKFMKEVLADYNQTKSSSKTAEKFGISRQTVVTYSKTLEVCQN